MECQGEAESSRIVTQPRSLRPDNLTLFVATIGCGVLTFAMLACSSGNSWFALGVFCSPYILLYIYGRYWLQSTIQRYILVIYTFATVLLHQWALADAYATRCATTFALSATISFSSLFIIAYLMVRDRFLRIIRQSMTLQQ